MEGTRAQSDPLVLQAHGAIALAKRITRGACCGQGTGRTVASGGQAGRAGQAGGRGGRGKRAGGAGGRAGRAGGRGERAGRSDTAGGLSPLQISSS